MTALDTTFPIVVVVFQQQGAWLGVAPLRAVCRRVQEFDTPRSPAHGLRGGPGRGPGASHRHLQEALAARAPTVIDVINFARQFLSHDKSRSPLANEGFAPAGAERRLGNRPKSVANTGVLQR